MACEEVREEESAGSPGVWWAPGVGANGDACRRRARPRHAPSRDRRSRVRPHITRGFHPMHTRVHSYSWSGGPYSYSTALIIQQHALSRSGAEMREHTGRGRAYWASSAVHKPKPATDNRRLTARLRSSVRKHACCAHQRRFLPLEPRIRLRAWPEALPWPMPPSLASATGMPGC